MKEASKLFWKEYESKLMDLKSYGKAMMQEMNALQNTIINEQEYDTIEYSKLKRNEVDPKMESILIKIQSIIDSIRLEVH